MRVETGQGATTDRVDRVRPAELIVTEMPAHVGFDLRILPATAPPGDASCSARRADTATRRRRPAAGGFAAGRRLDGPGQQTFDVRCTDIVTVRMVAGAAYGAGRDRRRAVARIEFFGRRS